LGYVGMYNFEIIFGERERDVFAMVATALWSLFYAMLHHILIVFLGILWQMKHVLICCPTDTCQYISQELVSAGVQKQVCHMAGGLPTPLEKSKDCSCWFTEITSAAVPVRVVCIASFRRGFPQDQPFNLQSL
jgi:hypothetical protein